MSFFSKLKEGLEKTRKNFTEKINDLVVTSTKIDEDFLEEFEATLIYADIGINTVENLMDSVKSAIKTSDIKTPEDLKPFLQKEITEILEKDSTRFEKFTMPPRIILVVGVNGVGKTTTIGKLANYYKQEGKKVIVAAADTFRAAAIDQLEIWSKRADIEIVKHSEGSDPAAVVFDAVSAAKARKTDIVIVDTAGRLHTKSNLMEELKKISRIINRIIPGAPHEILLVLDATTGQNAIMQTKIFQEALRLTGVVLTKLDGTAKGGVIVAIKNDLDLPVKWIGIGEGIDHLQPFIPADFAAALFDN